MPTPEELAAQAAATPAPQSTPVVTAPAVVPATPQAGAATEETAISLQEAKKLRKENKALRERTQAAEAKVHQLEAGQLSDQDRVAKELADTKESKTTLEERTRGALTYYAVALEAQKFGVVDSEAAAKLIDSSRLKYDSDGRPTNVAKLLKELVEEKPYLKAAPAPSTPTVPTTPLPSAGATTNPPTQNPSDPNSPTTSAPKSFDDYLANRDRIWAEIKAGTYQG